jgi:hypothetical protein
MAMERGALTIWLPLARSRERGLGVRAGARHPRQQFAQEEPLR